MGRVGGSDAAGPTRKGSGPVDVSNQRATGPASSAGTGSSKSLLPVAGTFARATRGPSRAPGTRSTQRNDGVTSTLETEPGVPHPSVRADRCSRSPSFVWRLRRW